MNNIRQRQQQHIQQNNNPTTSEVNFKIVNGFVIIIMLGFFALSILSIITLIVNKNQSQILIMCILIMLLSIGTAFSFFYLFSQISITEENTEQQKNDELFLNKPLFQSTRDFFFAFSGLSKFYIIRYQYIYSTLAIFFLISKILPTTKRYCKDDVDGYYHEVDNNNNDEGNYYYDCFSVQQKPLYEGPMLNILGYFSAIISFIIWLIETVRIQRYICYYCQCCCRYQYSINDYILSSQNLDQQQTIKSLKIFLFIAVCYSILKIILLCLIAIFDDNESSLILICSNIYFHLIMFLIYLRIQLLIKEDIQENNLLQIMNDSQNYMTLITYKFSSENNCNKFFYFLVLLSLPFCVAGAIIHEKRQNVYEIINFDHFVFFDCLIMQIIAIVLIIINFFIKPCLNYTNGSAPYVHQVGQENIIRNEQQQLQPLNNINQQPQNMIQNQVMQNENIELNTQANQRYVYLPPIQIQYTKKSPYIYNIKLSKQTDCTICLQLMTNDPGNQIVQLNCHTTHIFHYKCIHEWLQIHKQCPLCNAQF